MIRLIYLSTAIKRFEVDELEELLKKAQENNQKEDITGLLIIKDRTIIQCLEGEEDRVQKLYEKIEKDERHVNVMELMREDIEDRYFPDWEMGFKNISVEEYSNSTLLKDFDDMSNQNELPEVFQEFIEIY